MGVVFRGRDSRLQRDVALKLLPEQFANDADRLPRFEREAQVLASLNHPNIAQIYGLEQVNGSTCIVMELVEGETLEEKLKRGPLPVDEAVGIAKQIADALAAAHERGIIHRDLKPANIKLTHDGTVKVLDFGLAKALGLGTSGLNATTAGTVAGGSLAGAIVGTPGYMSPEQARGRNVDSRGDIWAFGCVLFEMLTGRQAFTGETITDILANIVSNPPDLDFLPKSTPVSIRQLLTFALNKNSSQRLQHIGDTRLFLDGPLAVPATTPVATASRRPRATALLLAALVLVVAGAGIFAALALRTRPEPAAQMRFEIALPDLVGTPIVSPDGKWISYATQPTNGKRVAWLRAIGSDSAQQIPGTENISGVIWSPDSRRLATLADGTLRMFDLASGSSRPLGSVGPLRGGSWNREGVLIMGRATDNIIVRMSDSGGDVTPITKLDAGRKEIAHGIPVFLPDNKHFLYVGVGGKAEDSGIFRASLDVNESPTRVFAIEVNNFNGMTYVSSGHLLYSNQGRLSAQRIDAMGQPQGNPIVVADNVDGGFMASDTGLLFYHKATPRAGRQLLWFGRDGKSLGQVGVEANYGNVDISPKGDRAAVDILTNGNRDIWVVDLERSVAQPITFDPGSDWSASWSPDGTRLAFASNRASGDAVNRIYEKSSTGTGTEAVLPSGDAPSIPVNWSSDGKYIVFSRLRQAGNTSSYDTWLLPTFGDRKPAPLLESGFDKFQARVSPNSNFVAYSTNESGTYQIVVQTFPDASGGKWQITADGGVEPKWRRDGRELYYLSLDGKLMSVPIGGPPFTAGRPVELFQTPLTVNRSQPTRDRRYDIAANGNFLMVIPSATAAPTPYSVVVNWTEGLEK
jgi:serine/threonine protein kinase/Tol biopolymer transport system component